MDNLTGNTLGTNEFLDIEEILRDARERSERTETANWIGTIKYMLWNATGMMPNLDWIVREWKKRKYYFRGQKLPVF